MSKSSFLTLILLIIIAQGFSIPKNAESEQKADLYIETSHTASVKSIVFSPDGKLFASAGIDNTVKLWDVATKRELNTFNCDVNDIVRGANSVSFSIDSQFVVAGCQHSIKFWNVVNGTETRAINTAEEVDFVIFSPNGEILATGIGKDIKLWNVKSGEQLQTLKGHKNIITEIAFSFNGEIMASAAGYLANGEAKDNTIRLWNAKSGKLLRTLDAHKDNVRSVKFSPDGKTIISCSSDSTVRLWDTATGKLLKTEEGFFDSVGFTPDGKTIVGAGGSIFVWDATITQQITILKKAGDIFAFAPDGKTFVSSGSKTIMFWDWQTKQIIKTLEAQTNEANSLIFSPLGGVMAVANRNGTIKLWNMKTADVLKTLKGHKGEIQGVSFSPDGKILASASDDKTIKLWDIATGQEITTLIGHTKTVWATKFSPDGKILASSSFDKTVKLWNLETFQEIKTLIGHAGSSPSMAFSADSKNLASGNSEKTILWNVTTGEIIESFSSFKEAYPKLKTLVPDYYEQYQSHPNATISVKQVENAKLVVSDYKSGQTLATLLALQEDSWIVTTPDGRFDTNKSLDKIEGLHWIVNNEILKPLSLDVFLRQYYEPGLLRRVLRCHEDNDCDKEFNLLPSIADINRVQPGVVIKEIKAAASATDLVDVTVEIENVTDDVSISATDRTKKKRLSSGVFDVRLFRDGQMIGNSTPTEKLASFYQAAPELIEQNKKYFAETKQLTNTPEDEAWRTANNLAEVKDVKFDGKSKYTYTFKNIKLPHDGRKEVEFTAYAFNADRVKSDNVVKTFPIPATTANKPNPKRAFVITFGVNKYQSSSWDLQFAANDARAMRDILADKLRKTNDFAEVVEIPLISDDETVNGKTLQKRDATKQNVQTVLDLLAGKTADAKRLKTLTDALGAETVGKIKPANPEDAVFISFSSHGYADRNGIFYILPTDIGAGLPRTVTPELLRNSISSDELSLWLRDVDAGEMVMIVDACNAEAAVKNSEFKPAPMGSRGLGQLAYDKGMKILTATQAANVAIETGAVGHGLLTYALIGEGLGKENKADFRAADKTINLKEWLEYGEFRVPGLYDDLLNKRLKIVGKGTDVIDLSGDNPKLNSSSQTPVLFDFTKRRQELTLVRLP